MSPGLQQPPEHKRSDLDMRWTHFSTISTCDGISTANWPWTTKQVRVSVAYACVCERVGVCVLVLVLVLVLVR